LNGQCSLRAVRGGAGKSPLSPTKPLMSSKNEFLKTKKVKNYSSVLFPEIQKEFLKNKQIVGGLRGLFIIIVRDTSKKSQEWYCPRITKRFLNFQGNDSEPTISTQKPTLIPRQPVVIIEIQDKDILKFITGGMHGLKAINEERVKIAGDLNLARELENVFLKAGGREMMRQCQRLHQCQRQWCIEDRANTVYSLRRSSI
jgi:SCP-2 sterol transfer family